MLGRTLSLIMICLLTGFSAAAQSERLSQLFDTLSGAHEDEWEVVEDEIWELWSQSGSPAMDLLLERGRQEMVAGNSEAAIEHLSALVDHAPTFAEGWNARATAYFQAGLYGPSLADIRQTLLLEPRHFGALAGMGLILEELGQTEGALAAMRRGAAIHPRRTDFVDGIKRLELRILGKQI